MKINRGIAVALTAAILASGGGAASLATAQPAEAAVSQPEIDAAVTKILNDTNAERAKVGLPALKLAPAISTVSQNWSVEMGTGRGMIHNPEYTQQMPTPWISVGENVAQGYTPSTVTPAWMASEGHKKNILGNFTHIGIGYYIDDSGRGWFTQNFGRYEVPQLTEINEPVNTIGTNQITSSWLAKWDEPVDTYRAELYSVEGVLLQTKTSPTPEVTFYALNDFTDYNVKIYAQKADALGSVHTSPAKNFTVTTLEDLPTVTAPVNLGITSGEDSITASWSTPTSYNGQLLPYTLELLKDGVPVTTVQTSNSDYTFTGLQSNSNYTVNVTATTAIRQKTATAVSSKDALTLKSSIATVSEATNIAVTSETHDSVKVTWAAPAQVIGNSLKYVLTLSSDGKPDVSVVTADTQYVFTGLEQDTNYVLKIAANITAENGVNTNTSTGVNTNVKTLIDYNAVEVSAPVVTSVEVNPKSVVLNYTAPETLVGKIDNYTIIVKEEGKADRVLATTNASRYVVSGLSENTKYTFEVRANASSLNGANQASATHTTGSYTTPYAQDTVIVSAPNAVTATAPAYNEVNASWTAPSTIVGSVTGYKVTLKDGDTVVSTKTVTELNANFTGLNDYTEYTVEVQALATSADQTNTATSVSSNSTVQTPAHVAAPNAPTGLTVDSLGHDKATVSWTAPTVYGTIADYTVTVKEEGKADRTFKSTGTTYEITDLSELTTYTALVAANVVAKDGVKTATSPNASVGVTTVISPSTVKVNAPTNVATSNITHDSLKVSWTAPTGTIGNVYGYQVTVKDSDKIVSTKFAFLMNSTFTGLTDSTDYTVEVVALASSPDNTKNASSVAASTTVKTPAHVAAPNAPTEIKATSVTDKSAVITWTAPTDVFGRVVDYTVTVKEEGQADRTFKSTGTTYEITGLAENKEYIVDVAANVVSRDGSLTATSPVVRVAVETPYAAESVKVNPVTALNITDVTRTSMNVAWVAPTGTVGTLTGYTVKVTSDGETKTYTTNGTSYALTGLESGATYTVEVQAHAVSANGQQQATSTQTAAPVTTQQSSEVSVAAPVATVSGVGSDRFTVAWNKPAVTGSITGYKVTVKKGATVVETFYATALETSTIIDGLDELTGYTVVVEASAVAEDGITTAKTSSAVQNVTTIISDDSKVSVATPGALETSSTLDSVTANWEAPAVTGKLTGYTVTLSQGSTVVKTVTVTDTTATFSGLPENSGYTVSVVANATSNNGNNSAVSSAVTGNIATKIDENSKVAVAAPVSLEASSTLNSVTANWEAPAVTGKIDFYLVTLKKGETVVKTVMVTDTTATFTGLTESTDYTVVVFANASSNNGKFSVISAPSSKNIATQMDENSKVAVEAPVSLEASSTLDSVSASWGAPTVTGKLTGYTVTLKLGNNVVKTVTTENTTATFSGLGEGNRYTVSVVANATSNNGKNSAVSAAAVKEISTKIDFDSKVAVGTPASLVASSTANSVTASWGAPTVTGKLTGYTVTLSQGNNVVKTVTVRGTSAVFSGLAESTNYTVSVVAHATSINEKNSASSAAATKTVATPLSADSRVFAGVPVALETASTDTSVAANWKTPAITGKLTGYTVTLLQGNQVVKVISTTSTNAVFSGLRENSAFTVTVVAHATSNNDKFSASSAAAVQNVSTLLNTESRVSVGVPNELNVSTKANSVTAKWKKPAVIGRLTSFTVTLVKGGKVVKTIHTMGTRTTFSGLDENTGYVVYVKANAISLNGKFNAVSDVVGQAVVTDVSVASKVSVEAPESLDVAAKKDTVTAKWKKSKVTGDVTSYNVTVKQGNKTVASYYTTGTKVTFYGLKADTKYTVEVKANAKSSNGKYRATSETTSKEITTNK